MDGSTASTTVSCSNGRLDDLAGKSPGRWQRRLGVALCVASLVATIVVRPFAATMLPAIPGFVASYHAALMTIYALTAYLFFAQARHARLHRAGAAPLLVLGAGALYTMLIVFVQLLSFPAVFGAEHVIGNGPETTTWLWVMWHIGPPVTAIAYACNDVRQRMPRRSPGTGACAPWLAAGAAILAAGTATFLATVFVARLPHTVDGDDYTALLSSGIGPAVVAISVLSLIGLVWLTRLRTVLQLWLAVSLVLLVSDNAMTLAGGLRGSVGWTAGRIAGLLAGLVMLVMYLRQIDQLYSDAKVTVIERETVHAEIERTRDHLAIALDAAGMGDWEVDLATGVSRRTLRHDQIFGYCQSVPRWTRATLLRHVLPDDHKMIETALKRALTEGRLEVTCRIRRAGDDALRWITVRGRTNYDADGRPVTMAGIVMDTTENRAADERVKQAERMEVVGQLTGGVAHDFNNLLTVITGNLDLIARRAGEPPEVMRLAHSAMAAARRGADVTGKLLSFSRRQMVCPQTVNVNRLLADLKPRLERTVSERHTIILNLDPTLDPIVFDPGQFEAAILNLILNAADATALNDPSGSVIIIATGAVTIAQNDPSFLGEPDADIQTGEYVRIAVTDAGQGMDTQVAVHAFEPFFTTKEVGTSAGLGLSQVYGFAEQAHGHVRLDTAPGRGTTVEILLPRRLVDVARQQGIHEGEVIPLRRSCSGEIVLVVEDETSVREMAVESLQDLGYQPISAIDASDALAQLQSDQAIDILFSDVIMPGGMNAVQLAVEARRLRPRLRVLLTSGCTALADDRTVPSDVQLLPKPYRRAQLATKLQVVNGAITG